MIVATLPLLLPCSQDIPLDRLAAERVRNEKAYRAEYLPQRGEMRKRHRGKWLVVVAGRVLPVAKGRLAPAVEMAAADALARKVAPKARHRFVFRIGDEGDRHYEMGMCELTHVAGNAFMGRLGGDFMIGPSGVAIKRKGKYVTIGAKGPDKRPFLAPRITAPGKKRGARQLFCMATGFTGDVTLSRRTTKGLGLELWEIPGRTWITGITQKGECSRAYVRFDLGGEGGVAVMPVSIWEKERKPDGTTMPKAKPAPGKKGAPRKR